MNPERPAEAGHSVGDPTVLELQRRIEELEGMNEAAFGEFTSRDWWICILGSLVIPLLALWWFAG